MLLFTIFCSFFFSTVAFESVKYGALELSPDHNAINIAYTVDISSAAYFMLSVASIEKYKLHSTNVIIYAVACGQSKYHSMNLMDSLRNSTRCFSEIKFHFTTFVHDDSSPLRLSYLKGVGKPHWYGDTETVRVLLPDILQAVNKFIYFDNDVIITNKMMLESLWSHELVGNAVIGMVMTRETLDYSVFLMREYFNTSSPIMIKIFEQSTKNYSKIHHNYQRRLEYSQKSHAARKRQSKRKHKFLEYAYQKFISNYLQAVPDCPNNGVILIDAAKWRKDNLSAKFVELATVNMEAAVASGGKGLHLAWGSQPAMIALLHKRWIALPQEYNLRSVGSTHVLDALNKFQGMGIMHFAGATKPHESCNISRSFFDHSEHRGFVLARFALQAANLSTSVCPSNAFPFSPACEQVVQEVGRFCDANLDYYHPWSQHIHESCRIATRKWQAIRQSEITAMREKQTRANKEELKRRQSLLKQNSNNSNSNSTSDYMVISSSREIKDI